jgi:hypothetical protein
MKEKIMKIKIGILVASAILSNCINAQINSGVISQYYFCGNANDNVGGNNGTVSGAVLSPDRFGNPNNAYTFNGQTDLINLGSSNALKQTVMSISLWAKVNGYTQTAVSRPSIPFISTRANTFSGNYEAYFMGWYIPSTQFCFAASTSSGGQVGHIVNVTPNLNVWNHLVYMFDNDTTYTYVNGILKNKSYKGFVSTYVSGDPVYLGYVTSNNVYSYLNGSLDDIRIYNRLLTVSEVNQLYNEPSPLPNLNITSNHPISCPKDVVSLTASGGSSYVWNTNATTTSILVNPMVTTSYSVTGINPITGCMGSAAITQTVSLCLGLSSNAINDEFQIYPNPASNSIQLKSENETNVEVTIFDITGRLVLKNQLENLMQNNSMETTSLSNGIYVIEIKSHTNEQLIKREKLVIRH